MNRMSRHAETRAQQRSIPPLVLDWLTRFGEEQHDHKGCMIMYFSHKSIRKLQRAYGCQPIRLMKRYFDAYAVERTDGSAIMTTGWRTQRINRT